MLATERTLTSGTAPGTDARDAREPRVLSRVGRYVVEGVLGRGGMAAVYLARDPALDRTVALKIMHGDDEGDAARLLREGQAIARVSHPNVIHVYEAGREDELVFVAMERIDGTSLEDWLRVPRSHREIVAAFAAAGSGLAAAHAAGLVHRDFKPDNVMVGADGRVRVLDFGLAREHIDGEPDAGTCGGALLGETAVGAVVGTPAYMSPEQWRGDRPGPRSDQFSFCVALARALLGEHPFDTSTRELLRSQVLVGEHKRLPHSVPRNVRAALRRGMTPDPDERFPTMEALLAALAPRPRWHLPAALLAATGIATGALALHGSTASGPEAIIYRAPVQLTSRGDVGAATVSPDGTQLAVLGKDVLLVQPTRGDGAPRVLARGRFAYYTLAWSPDGRTLGLVAGAEGDTRAPGFVTVDVATGAMTRIAENLGMVALLPDDEVAAVRFAGKELAFYSLTAPAAAARRCPLPAPFQGIRSVRYDAPRDEVLVQLDRDDSTTVIVRVDRQCKRMEVVAGPHRALFYTLRSSDQHVLARMLGRNDLVDAQDGTRRVLQSADYEPLAIDGDDRVIHLDRFTRWHLGAVTAVGAREELAGGTATSRFAVSSDGARIAQVDGVQGRGELRAGSLAQLRTGLPVLATGVSRAAWSPEGDRLAALTRTAEGYDLAVYDVATATWSPPQRAPIRYESGMTWIDARRVAFETPHDYRGFAWLDPASGETGVLEVGGGVPTLSLARAHRGDALAFVTETETEIRAWLGARVLASIRVTSPRSSRRARVVWAADDASLIVYDGFSGERWSVRIADGTITREADIPLPAASGFAELTEVAALPDRLLVQIVTQSADVYISRPLEAE